jgi:hypothetical protein
MTTTQTDSASVLQVVQGLPVPLERDVFLRTLIRELAGTLQEVVGLGEASGFISVFGHKVGNRSTRPISRSSPFLNSRVTR